MITINNSYKITPTTATSRTKHMMDNQLRKDNNPTNSTNSINIINGISNNNNQLQLLSTTVQVVIQIARYRKIINNIITNYYNQLI